MSNQYQSNIKFYADTVGNGGGLARYPTRTAFPTIGNSNLIYLASDTGFIYYWDITTSTYIQAVARSSTESLIGGWDASGGTFPTAGSAPDGSIAKGDYWYITVAGTLGGENVVIGASITALKKIPAQLPANWLIISNAVDSVFNRYGNIVAQTGDYNINQIANVDKQPLVAYVTPTGDDTTATLNNALFNPFATLQTAQNALEPVFGVCMNVYGENSFTYGDLIAKANSLNLIGVTNYVEAGNLTVTNPDNINQGSSMWFKNVKFNNLSSIAIRAGLGSNTYERCTFNNVTYTIPTASTYGMSTSDTFTDCTINGGIDFFTTGFAKQTTVITYHFQSVTFNPAKTITLNGSVARLNFNSCVNIPSIVYANGATSAQVTIIASFATSGANPNSVIERDSNVNFATNNMACNVNNVTASAVPINLTASSAKVQNITGTVAQTFTLPNATSLYQGISYYFNNQATANVVINYNDNSNLATIGQQEFLITLTNNLTSKGTWILTPLKDKATSYTASTTLTDASTFNIFNVTTADANCTMPTASFANTGNLVKIVNNATSTKNVNVLGLVGGTSVLNSNQGLLAQSAGNAWYIISRYNNPAGNGAISGVNYASAVGAEVLTKDTWINGKPIWMKVVNFVNAPAGAVTTIDGSMKLANVPNIVNIFAEFKALNETFLVNAANSNSTLIVSVYQVHTVGLVVNVGSGRSSTNNCNVVVLYTKP